MFAIIPSKEKSASNHEEPIIFAENFGFKGALKPPVHITVCPYFEVNPIIAEAFERQLSTIQLWPDNQSQFEIILDGFDFPLIPTNLD
jgi:hypothetical protein